MRHLILSGRCFDVPLLLMVLFSIGLNGQNLVGTKWLDFISQEELVDKYGDMFTNGVDLYKLVYSTTSWNGELDTASGLLVVPDVPIQGIPMVIYQHGTINFQDSIPSNLAYESTIPIVYGGAGSIAIAPDYLGFGVSSGFHPYMHASTEASVGKDMIMATQEFVHETEFILNGQLFISGYSQGGHAAAALHRLIESDPIDGMEISASAFMSGAYSLSSIMYNTILGTAEYSDPAFVMNILLSYNMVYNLYNNLSQLFRPPFDSLALLLFKEEINLGRINELLVEKLNQIEGGVLPKKMIRDSILTRLDTINNHPIQVALRDNDVYNWAPQSPVLLVYCPNDEKVPAQNAIFTDSVMRKNGATSITLLLANEDLLHFDCAEPAVLGSLLFFESFITSRNESHQVASNPIFYPNPTSGFINITSFPEQGRLRLYDLYGRILHDEQFNDEVAHIDVNNMHDGIYFWTVETLNLSWNGTFTVIH